MYCHILHYNTHDKCTHIMYTQGLERVCAHGGESKKRRGEGRGRMLCETWAVWVGCYLFTVWVVL